MPNVPKLNVTPTDTPYLKTFNYPGGPKKYLAAGSRGGTKGIKRSFPFTPEGKKDALGEIEKWKKTWDLESIKIADRSIYQLKDGTWRYKRPNKPLAGPFLTKKGAETFRDKAVKAKYEAQKKPITETEISKVKKEIEKGKSISKIAADLDIKKSRVIDISADLKIARSLGNIPFVTKDEEAVKYIKENHGKLKRTTMAKNVYPDLPLSTSNARVGQIIAKLLKEKKIKRVHFSEEEIKERKFYKDPKNIQSQQTSRRRVKKLAKLGSKSYETHLQEYKRKLQAALGLPKIKDKFYPIDLAHRTDITQLKALSEKLTPSDLGPDYYRANREGISKFKDGVKTLERLLRPLYTTQKNLFKQASNFDTGKIPAVLKQKIDKNNKAISELVGDGIGGRIKPIRINVDTLDVLRGNQNVMKTLGIGIIDTPMSEVQFPNRANNFVGSVDDVTIKANLGQQVLREAVERGLIKEKIGQSKLNKFFDTSAWSKRLPKSGRVGAAVTLGLGAGALLTGGAKAALPETKVDELKAEEVIESNPDLADTMVYNAVEGKFVDAEDGDPEDQMGKLNWIADNPVKSSLMAMPAAYGLGQGANKLGLAKTAQYLTSWKAMIPAMMVPEKLWQYREGESLGEMATDPWNTIWALGIDSSKSLAKKGQYYVDLLPEGHILKEQFKKATTHAARGAIGRKAFEVTGANILGKEFWNSGQKMTRLGQSITSPAAAGTDLAFNKRFKPAMKKMADVFGSQVSNKLAKRGIGSLAKRALMLTAAGAGLAATGVAGAGLSALALTLFGADYIREQFTDYGIGKAKVDKLRSMGKISEDDAKNYMSLLMQENLLPFGLGNRMFGDEEMMIGGQVYDPSQQREIASMLEDDIDSVKDDDKEARAKWRQQEFFNEGGRVGMKFGGSMGRREFLKWIAGLTAGAGAALKGIWKPGVKPAIEQVTKKAVTSANPELWIPRLIAKIKAEGKLLELADKKYVTGDQYEMIINGQKVKMESNPINGTHMIEWQAPDYDGEMTRSIQFTEGEWILPSKTGEKPIKAADEFIFSEPDRSTPYRDDAADFDWVNDSDQILDDMKKWIGLDDVPDKPTGPKTGTFDEGSANWPEEFNEGGEVETGAIARRQSEVPPLSGPDPQGILALLNQPKQVSIG